MFKLNKPALIKAGKRFLRTLGLAAAALVVAQLTTFITTSPEIADAVPQAFLGVFIATLAAIDKFIRSLNTTPID